MASAAPGVRVLPVRVLGKCGGYDSDIVAGMRWAAGLARARRAGQSPPRAGDQPEPRRRRAVLGRVSGGGRRDHRRGTVIVAAAGNSSGHAVGTPANCSGVIAVAGLRHAGTKVGFSSLGPEVAISAPGGNCVNTAPDSPCLYPILTTTDSGDDGAGDSTYTDSFNFSRRNELLDAPRRRRRRPRPVGTPRDDARSGSSSCCRRTARPFPTWQHRLQQRGPQCTPPQFNLMGRPIDQLECYCTTATCGAGMLDAGGALVAAQQGSDKM